MGGKQVDLANKTFLQRKTCLHKNGVMKHKQCAPTVV